MNISQRRVIRFIAIFKFLKAATLVAFGLAAIKLIHADAAETLDHLVRRFGLEVGGHYIDRAVGKVASIPPNKLRDIGLGSFVYAALFLTEGIGLWMEKRWAEWLTTVITASLLPLEIYELYRHLSAAKLLVLLINIAIVIYLIAQIWREKSN